MTLETLYSLIDKKKDEFIARLAKAVAIPSVSADVNLRPKVYEMADFVVDEFTKLGAKMEKRDIGSHEMEGQEVPLPPIVLGQYGSDPSKKTVLIYNHFDVQPASVSDGWSTDPFKLEVDSKDRMIARGVTDDKGPLIGWISAVQAYQECGLDFPVNLLMCFEGMEEYGSEGLDDLIRAEAQKYFAKADCVCISDTYWLGTKKPVLTYGLRGVSYFSMTVQGPGADLHSGVFGGTVHEPMTDLIAVMSSLVKPNGEILIPGIMDQVAKLTSEEDSLYDTIDYEMSDLENAAGADVSIYPDTKRTLQHRWRYPTLSLHGIEGAFSGSGAKTVIPAKVNGKFSIRTVPDMEPETVRELVQNHVEKVFSSLGSKNKLTFHALHAGAWWSSSPKHWHYDVGSRATERVFGVKPDFVREGGSIPVTVTFEHALNRNVLLLPMGRGDDGAHSINEKLDLDNFMKGIKLFCTYVHELSLEKQ
ncbi:dipeptidase Dug1 [Schizosaccharomyces osmophilus]|uniref:Dipeptidase Dug1 n=1 Tax=Schizosaccharomyces osmophilus TaxID=2545709 RepID=A0AAE9WAM6_9SCHI|nr:dipeptidase Dug1 [Schizosaccharomyces osmophilus]WBW72690.1 dipeptidase Dug1 [Schizosaccharomyces osmophilus]